MGHYSLFVDVLTKRQLTAVFIEALRCGHCPSGNQDPDNEFLWSTHYRTFGISQPNNSGELAMMRFWASKILRPILTTTNVRTQCVSTFNEMHDCIEFNTVSSATGTSHKKCIQHNTKVIWRNHYTCRHSTVDSPANWTSFVNTWTQIPRLHRPSTSVTSLTCRANYPIKLLAILSHGQTAWAKDWISPYGERAIKETEVKAQ